MANLVVNQNLILNGMGANGFGALQFNGAGMEGTPAATINLATLPPASAARPATP